MVDRLSDIKNEEKSQPTSWIVFDTGLIAGERIHKVSLSPLCRGFHRPLDILCWNELAGKEPRYHTKPVYWTELFLKGLRQWCADICGVFVVPLSQY